MELLQSAFNAAKKRESSLKEIAFRPEILETLHENSNRFPVQCSMALKAIARAATNMVLFELSRRERAPKQFSSLASAVLNKYSGTQEQNEILGYRGLSDEDLIGQGQEILNIVNEARDMIVGVNHKTLGWIGLRYEGEWIEVLEFVDAFDVFKETQN